jgi:hypothetical protein
VTQGADFRDLMVAMEIFKDTTFDQKMKEFMKICDIWKNGYVNYLRIYNVLKIICMNIEAKERLKMFILDIVSNLKTNTRGYFNKHYFLIASRDHMGFRNLLDESIKNIKKVDKLVENDLEENFNSWIPLANDIVKYKEGIHFPEVNQMLTLVKYNEGLTKKIRDRKKNMIEEVKDFNAKIYDDLNDDFDDFEL